MSYFYRILVAVLFAVSVFGATNEIAPARSTASDKSDTNNPVERELQKLMDQDNEAQAEVDQWIQDNNKFAEEGAGVPRQELNARIRKRFEPVRRGYENFIQQHTNHVQARVAYASFLGDIGDEEGSFRHLEIARDLDPKDPAIWNNLANYYGHNGELSKAFDYYTKAIELNPEESVYYHNFGTTVFLFRKDAKEHYGITEQQVFDKALDLYSKALKKDPENFPLATDVAMTYYGIQPRRTDAGLAAWTNALTLAHDEIEREGVYIHFARMKIAAERFNEARAHLNSITNEMYADLKNRLSRNLTEKEAIVKKADASETSEKKGESKPPKD